MIRIEIKEEVETSEDMVYLLEDISRKIRTGLTSGYYPTWELVFETFSEDPNFKGDKDGKDELDEKEVEDIKNNSQEEY